MVTFYHYIPNNLETVLNLIKTEKQLNVIIAFVNFL